MGLARELSQGPRRRSAPKMRPVFYRLHAATLNRGTTLEELRDALEAAEAMPERRRLSEGAVYTSALRRWEFMTGEPYTREGEHAYYCICGPTHVDDACPEHGGG